MKEKIYSLVASLDIWDSVLPGNVPRQFGDICIKYGLDKVWDKEKGNPRGLVFAMNYQTDNRDDMDNLYWKLKDAFRRELYHTARPFVAVWNVTDDSPTGRGGDVYINDIESRLDNVLLRKLRII